MGIWLSSLKKENEARGKRFSSGTCSACCTHNLGIILAERASGIEKGVLYQQSRKRQRRRRKVDANGAGRSGTESEGEMSDQPSTPRQGTESEDWFFHSDSESDATVFTALSLVNPNAASPVLHRKIRSQLGAEAMEHLTRESLSTQALWQITGGSNAASGGVKEKSADPAMLTVGDRSVTQGDQRRAPTGHACTSEVGVGKLFFTTAEGGQSHASVFMARPTVPQKFECELVAADEVKYSEAMVGIAGQCELKQCDGNDLAVVGTTTRHVTGGGQGISKDDAKELKGALKRIGSDSTSWNSKNEVIFENPNSFGSSVSKSFYCDTCGHVSNTAICIPKFQIVRNAESVQHAEFLVVVELGTFTFGVWRRYTDFVDLADSIMATDEQKEVYPNSIFSWQCMRFRKRWYKCLDKDYLTVKCFLLERFLHDLVCESSNPAAIFHFIGV